MKENTEQKVLIWAKEKSILAKDNILNQLDKFIEEVDEFYEEVIFDNKEAAKMELGDVLVTLSILANQLDTDLQNCLKMAYDKIKVRKGKTVNGNFIKDKKQ